MIIKSANVFDPALSGEDHLPVRLELLLADVPDEPTKVELDDVFSVTHRSWLQSIFSDEPDWNPEYPADCAVRYNSYFNHYDREAVVPVTVSVDGEMWRDYFVRIKKVRRILSRLENGYELLPDPTWLAEKKIGWYIQHKSRVCIDCVYEEAQDEDLIKPDGNLWGDMDHWPSGNDLRLIHPHRLAAICPRHEAVRNSAAATKRTQYAG